MISAAATWAFVRSADAVEPYLDRFQRNPSDNSLRYAALGVFALIVLVFLVPMVLRPFLVWASTRLVVTDQRLVLRTGVISRKGRDMPLRSINDVSYTQSWAGRVLGYGTLTVESAAEHGRITVPDLPQVAAVQTELARLGGRS